MTNSLREAWAHRIVQASEGYRKVGSLNYDPFTSLPASKPGTKPVPSGGVRGFHYTSPDHIRSILNQGLLGSVASPYSEEGNVVWAQAGVPQVISGASGMQNEAMDKVWVEFWTPVESCLVGTGSGGASQMESHGSHFAVVDVPPSRFLGVYLPWHFAYWFLDSSNHRQRALDGELDFMVDDYEYGEAYGPAIKELKKRGSRLTAALVVGEVPPEPGKSPLPPGTVRGFHYSPMANLESIRSNGLRIDRAKGSRSQEPDWIWFSGRPDYWQESAGTFLAEVAVPPELILNGGPSGNFAIGSDVPPSWILAIHEAWHGRYRYMTQDKGARKNVIDGEHDNLISTPDYGPAILKIKAEGVRSRNQRISVNPKPTHTKAYEDETRCLGCGGFEGCHFDGTSIWRGFHFPAVGDFDTDDPEQLAKAFMAGPGRQIGEHFTRLEHVAEGTFALPPHGQVGFLLQVRDWKCEDTIAVSPGYSHEREIALRPGAMVKLDWCYAYPDPAKYKSGRLGNTRYLPRTLKAGDYRRYLGKLISSDY